jgi:hypothetical protein
METLQGDASKNSEGLLESADVIKDFSYYKLYQVSERQLWKISDLPWDQIDTQGVATPILNLIRELAYAELTTYSATHGFMNLFEGDLDFTQWLSLWFYEEAKHPLVLMKWLSYFGEQFDTQFISKGREIHPMRNNRLEMLCMNVISEVTVAQAYGVISQEVKEPVLKLIAHHLSVDETRHANGFFTYSRNIVNRSENLPAAQLTALRILFYCLFSQDQKHPVNEFMMRIRNDFSDTTMQFGLNEPIVQKTLFHKFSQMTGLQMSSKQDVVSLIQELRNEIGEANS